MENIYSTSLNNSSSSGFESQTDSIDLMIDENDLCQSNDINMDSEVLEPVPDYNIKLWQFLVELLEDKRCKHLIRWVSSSSNEPLVSVQAANERTYNYNEFVLLDPIEISRRWAIRKNKPFSLTYNKFRRVLRYYYNKKKILQKIIGKPNTFIFQINVQPYINELALNKNNFEF